MQVYLAGTVTGPGQSVDSRWERAENLRVTNPLMRGETAMRDWSYSRRRKPPSPRCRAEMPLASVPELGGFIGRPLPTRVTLYCTNKPTSPPKSSPNLQGRLFLPPNLYPPTAVSTGVIGAGKLICGGSEATLFLPSPASEPVGCMPRDHCRHTILHNAIGPQQSRVLGRWPLGVSPHVNFVANACHVFAAADFFLASNPGFFRDAGCALDKMCEVCEPTTPTSSSLKLLRLLSQRGRVVAAAVAAARAGTAVDPGQAYGDVTAALITAALDAAETHRARGIYGPGCMPRDHWDTCLRSGVTGCAVETARGVVLLIRWCLADAEATRRGLCSAPLSDAHLFPQIPLGMEQFSRICSELGGSPLVLPENGSVVLVDLAEAAIAGSVAGGTVNPAVDSTSHVVLVSVLGRDHLAVVQNTGDGTWLVLSDQHAKVVLVSPSLVAIPVLISTVARDVGAYVGSAAAAGACPTTTATVASVCALSSAAVVAAAAASTASAASASSSSAQGVNPCEVRCRAAAANTSAVSPGTVSARPLVFAGSYDEDSSYLAILLHVSSEVAAMRTNCVPPEQIAIWRLHRDAQRYWDQQMFDARGRSAARYFAKTTGDARRQRAHITLQRIKAAAVPLMKVAEQKQAREQNASHARHTRERLALRARKALQLSENARKRELLAVESQERSRRRLQSDAAAARASKAARRAKAAGKAAASSAADRARRAAPAAAAAANAARAAEQARREAASCCSSAPRDGVRGQCAVCQSAASHRCTGCNAQWYCSDAHQKAHWSVHRPKCTRLLVPDGIVPQSSPSASPCVAHGNNPSAALLRCCGCRSQVYCCAAQQIAHWKVHRPACKRQQAQDVRAPPSVSASAVEASAGVEVAEYGIADVGVELWGIAAAPMGTAAAAAKKVDTQQPPRPPSSDMPMGTCALKQA